jgi:hypothetical protein
VRARVIALGKEFLDMACELPLSRLTEGERQDESFPCLSLLTDLWFRKIVGCHAVDTLEAEGSSHPGNGDTGNALRDFPRP